MSADWLAPVRSARSWAAPGGTLGYDTWGAHGRPVLLLHAPLFDRTMWWPVAADLRTEATMIAVDLPGHGASPGRDHYHPEAVVEDLAHLVHGLGATRAPVVVGHGGSAGLAALFAVRFAAHALVTVDACAGPGGGTPVDGDHVRRYLATMPADALPPSYRGLVTAKPDPALLAGYLGCGAAGPPGSAGPDAGRLPPAVRRLDVHSQGTPGETAAVPGSRTVVYGVPGRFAHLADVPRFGSDVRSVL
ncbi:hypothetical protein GCM10020358_61720 [Amorphoplanes nipponensis]|uniref:Alpha/beta hydrolase family protein n=1 Tax=Actinoplanes nipponensis TaxID=135950 RepID=A0A919MY12_9ACTN|nr:alpha/beta hydrolase [Actinoplanes nipponensis]GIE53975.1 hypothetical protein Ani05nite_75090 [Actinoplanes nipponensis]